jgi:PKD repeat protein
MGCSKIIAANLAGPLSVNFSAQFTNTVVANSKPFYSHYDFLVGTVQGQAAYLTWSFGDGPTYSNLDGTCSHEWISPGSYTVTFTAYNNDNPNGVSTNLVVNVQSLLPAQMQSYALLSNGFSFQFAGQTDANYTIQYTTNLAPPISWQTLQYNYYNTQPVIQVIDPAGTNGARFYRVTTQ